MGALQLIESAASHPSTGERVRYAYRVYLIGTDSSGAAFEDEVKTELVTRDGALIVIDRSLSTDSVLFMRREGRVVQGRVLGQVGLRQEEYLYGVVFNGAGDARFWGLEFSENSSEVLSRKLLECSRCSRQDALTLHEIEKVVYESMRGLPRRCTACAQETLWVEPPIPGEVELVTGSASYELTRQPETTSRTALAGNRRKHVRTTMKNVRARLDRTGFPKDVVKVLDMSRGGIRFVSAVDYPPGTQVSVAVPYTPDGSNVFSKAKIVRVQSRPRDGVMGEFGLQYLKA